MAKIDIFSGFLGAGKTTLISKLLKEALADTKVVLEGKTSRAPQCSNLKGLPEPHIRQEVTVSIPRTLLCFPTVPIWVLT